MTSLYPAIKHLHLMLIAISVSFFFVRFFWNVRAMPIAQKKWVKISPHVIDTFLLLSGAALAHIVASSGIEMAWLYEKLMAVVAYIILAAVAIKSSREWLFRTMIALGALGWVIYASKLAVTKQPILFG